MLNETGWGRGRYMESQKRHQQDFIIYPDMKHDTKMTTKAIAIKTQGIIRKAGISPDDDAKSSTTGSQSWKTTSC